MWIFTKYGFFSVVNKDGGMIVRARSEDHIIQLKIHFRKILKQVAIETTPTADYGWRMKLSQAQWIEVAKELATEVDYDNFKAKIAAMKNSRDKYVHGDDYINVLHQIWQIMFSYQLHNRKQQTMLKWD